MSTLFLVRDLGHVVTGIALVNTLQCYFVSIGAGEFLATQGSIVTNKISSYKLAGTVPYLLLNV